MSLFSGLGTSTPAEANSGVADVRKNYLFKRLVGQGGGDVEDSDKDRFRAPLSADELELLKNRTFAENTEKKVSWAVDLFKEWWRQRAARPGCDMRILWGDLNNVRQVSKGNLAFSLCAFVSEVKKKDGTEYPGATLYQIIICIQFFLQKHGIDWKILDDPDFVRLRFTLDNVMKQRAKARLGLKKSAQVISVTDEEKMWSDGVLGDSNLDQLRNTLMYLLGINLALRGGEEHRRLRCPGHDPQIQVCVDTKGVKFLLYKEDFQSKTNQGGLRSRVCKPKELKVYGSTDETRSIVCIYEKYMNLLPQNSTHSALYKYSASKRQMSPNQWFADKPVGINSIKKVVKNLTESAGLSGKFSNHSLRTTCVTRMFAAGVEEQVIKSFTGHKSDAVHNYKRINEDILKKANATVSVSKPESTDVGATGSGKNADVEFDIDRLPLGEGYKSDVPMLSGPKSHSHKKRLCETICPENCDQMCTVLKKIDKLSEKRHVKKLKLSLKYRK